MTTDHEIDKITDARLRWARRKIEAADAEAEAAAAERGEPNLAPSLIDPDEYAAGRVPVAYRGWGR